MKKLNFRLMTQEDEREMEVDIRSLCIIGYAGRNIKKTKEHIAELAVLGVAPPKSVPEIYRCGTSLLTQDREIEAVGRNSSGEVEFIFFRHEGKLYIGIGSDQTDRAMESYHMEKSKQVCQKPVGTTLWDYEEIKEHWDSLKLTSWQILDGKEILYQKGTAADILPVETLLDAVEKMTSDMEDCLMFSGTVPLVNGFQYGSKFRGCIEDPIFERCLDISYTVHVVTE